MNVIVIGAGVIGASAADALAGAGHAVHVLDMRGPGRGASQASAGVLAPFIEAHDGDPWLDLCVESLSLYDAFIEGLRVRSRRPVQYQRSGTFEVAVSPDDVARLNALRAWLAARGVTSEWFDGAAAKAFEPAISAAALGALNIPLHGFVSVPDLVGALTHAASLAGASFESPAEAVSVTSSNASVTVSIGSRSLSADAVVVATGSWSSRVKVNGAPAADIRPIRGQLLHLKWPEDQAMPQRVVWSPRCYTVPWTDGSLLVGATVEDVGFDERSTVSGVHDLMAAAGDVLPAVWRATLHEVRVGLRPAPVGGLPIIGPSPSSPRVILATGHYRNGVLMAPLTAKKVVEAVER
ncbi:MAG: glycine oxidase ThiO [Acidobacteria bacterium]|nr:MAG: glycine oxidase ThiO [Acidobacteriota bacterium]